MTEFFSGNSERLNKEDRKKMSDVATANFLVEQIGRHRNVGVMLHAAWKELHKRFPHKEDPENRWTESRLKAWRYNESRSVSHFQMVELFETAEALRKARDAHDEYMAETARLRQMVELRKAQFNRDVAEG